MQNWYDISKKKECRLARYEGAEQERSIWYHGTIASNLPSILSNGLIVDPKIRAWSDHSDASFMTPSQASLKGIYVTRNLLTARIAAVRNIAKQEDRVIVIMELQPRSLVADEDSLTHYVKSVLGNSCQGSYEWLISEVYIANELGSNPAYVNDIKNKYIKTGVNIIDKQYGPLHPKLLERISEILENGWEVVLGRQASYIENYLWKASFYRNISTDRKKSMTDKNNEIKLMNIPQEQKDKLYSDYVETLIPKKPESNEYEEKYLIFMDQLTRTVKNAARPSRVLDKADMMTARSIENIGFSGSNRIISIVKLDKDFNVEIIYGTLPDDFKEQWRKTTGQLNIIKSASSNKLYKMASRGIWYHGTLMSNYKKIASEGLLANPQKRLWDKKDKGDAFAPSKASFPGIYLTNDLYEAIEAPENALDVMGVSKSDDSILLVIVQSDTQSLYIDEDAMSLNISSPIESTSDYLVSLIYLSGVSKIDIPYFNRIRDNFVERQMIVLQNKFKLDNNDLIKRVRSILRDGFIYTLTRQVAYTTDDEWKRAYLDILSQHERFKKQDKNFNNLKIPQKPSPAIGEEMFRKLMDQLTRTLKFSKHHQEDLGEFWTSGRYPENIGYRGSTKILSLVEVKSKEYGEFIDTTDYLYRVLYGTLPSKFVNDWKKLTNTNTMVIPQQKDEEKYYKNWIDSYEKTY